MNEPIFTGDRLNPNVVKKIKSILEKIGYSVEGRTWGKTFVYKGKVFTFNSYQEILDFLSGSTIDFDLTEEERALIVRFTDALNNVHLDLETQS